MKPASRQPKLPFPRLVAAPGPRAVEASLLRRIDELLPPDDPDPALLARPIWIVVPSRSLRFHWNAAIVRHRGRAVAGLAVRTHHGLAQEILVRGGERLPDEDVLFDLLARRLAAERPPLERALGSLRDGYAAVVSAVRDLLDAGLEPSLQEPVDEVLESLRAGGWPADELARVESIVNVALEVSTLFAERSWGRRIVALEHAKSRLDRSPETALPARAVLMTGYAEAVGLVKDFLETLLLRRQGELFLDQPEDPGNPGVADAGVIYTRRLEARLAPHAVVESAPAAPPPRRSHFAAPGATAEVREVAVRVRRLLDTETPPESIAIVARDLTPYRLPLRVELDRLEVPASGLGFPGPRRPDARWRTAWMELLHSGARTPTDTWLDSLGPLESEEPLRRFDLRLALRALGAVRVADVASLDLQQCLEPEDSYSLPVRAGLVAPPTDDTAPDDESGAPRNRRRSLRAARRRIAGPVLRHAVSLAGDLGRALEQWPEEADVSVHIAHLGATLRRCLLRGGDDEAALAPLTDAMAAEIPPSILLSPEEFRHVLARKVAQAERLPLAGAGGGVQLLTAMEARGRTFEHLFLLGLNRDVFPRLVRGDALLPEEARRALAQILPDIPLRQQGFSEERHLFAQLMSAANHVTTSWQTVGDDGRPRTPSPLLQRLGCTANPTGAARAPHPYGASELRADRPRAPRPRTAHHTAVLTALRGRAPELRAAAQRAAREAAALSGRAETPRSTDEAAAGRWNVLSEYQRMSARGAQAGLGPYLGFVGATREDDPRHGPIFVTRLEGLARCGWQVFLAKLLGLEPTPDPLQALPGVDALLLGNAVHAVLESIARGEGRQEADLAAALKTPPRPVRWPRPAVFDELLRGTCERIVADAGLGLPGLARVLEEQARPCLEVARQCDWSQEEVAVLGTELQGFVTVIDAEGRPRKLGFRADRVDASPGGGVLLTDYKTGKAISEAASAKARHASLLDAVSKGEKLQAIVYALATPEATGRFLFLKAGREIPQRSFHASADEAALRASLDDVARRVLATWDRGALFPRLVDPHGATPRTCEWCDVREACLQGDSGARARLGAWTNERGGTGEDSSTPHLDGCTPAEAAVLAAWRWKAGPARSAAGPR